MATITASATGGNWSATAAWVGGVVPGAGDDVLLTLTSGNITVDGVTATPSLCRSLNCTGYTGTLTMGSTAVLTIGNAAGGSLTLVATMTFSPNAASTINFVSTATGNTITSGGKTLGIVNWSTAGGWLLGDDFAAAGTATHSAGTFDANGHNLNLASWVSNSGTRTLNMGSGNWTVNRTGTCWNMSSSTGLTLNVGTSTVIIADTSSSAKVVAINGSGVSLWNLQINGAASAGTVEVRGDSGGGSHIKGALTIQPKGNVLFTATRTLILDNPPSWIGSSGNTIAISSTISASQATISCPSGTARCDWLVMRDNAATGGASFFAGANSTNTSNNTGWTFTAPVFNVTTSDSVTASDALSPALVFGVTTSDNVTAADSNAVVATMNPATSDSVTASDTLSPGNLISVSTSDAVTGADSLTAIATFNINTSDSVTAADAVNSGNIYNDTISDGVTASDSLTVAATMNALTSDNVTAADTISGGLLIVVTTSDGVIASDALIAAAIFITTISGSVTAADAIVGGAVYSSSISDSITAADSLTVEATFNASIMDAVIAGDVLAVNSVISASFHDDVLAMDSVRIGNVYDEAISNTVTARDEMFVPSFLPNYILNGWIQ